MIAALCASAAFAWQPCASAIPPAAVPAEATPEVWALLTGPEQPFVGPLPWAAFTLPTAHAANSSNVAGRLRLEVEMPAEGFLVLQDDFGRSADSSLRVRSLPPLVVDLLQYGDEILPVQRGSIAGDHPSWEWILQPGRVRDDPAGGGWHRALLPFSLHERNANCLHYGVLALRFRSGDAGSRAAWQVTSENCAYFRFDAWGRLSARFDAEPLTGVGPVAAAREAELERRWPVRPLAQLAVDHPGAVLGDFGDPRELPPASVTTFGVVVDGVHYSAGCPTRSGEFPFCAELPLPSYSLAKSLFAGLALMRLQALYPGAADAPIARWVPQCAAAGGWDDVTLEQAIGMATGRFDDPGPQVDEDRAVDSEFFLAEQHAPRIAWACSRYPRRTAPGQVFSYHTSDTYVAGTAMAALLRSRAGESRDLYRDLVVADVYRPLGLSPLTFESRRSRDAAAQPFTGWGLLFTADDVVRLSYWLVTAQGRIGGRPVLDRDLLARALQRDPSAPGLPAGAPHLRYRGGFWALDVSAYLGCSGPTWVPFLSGYGGISVALFPNGIIYYYFSDGGAWQWLQAARGAHRLRPMCESTAAGTR